MFHFPKKVRSCLTKYWRPKKKYNFSCTVSLPLFNCLSYNKCMKNCFQLLYFDWTVRAIFPTIYIARKKEGTDLYWYMSCIKLSKLEKTSARIKGSHKLYDAYTPKSSFCDTTAGYWALNIIILTSCWHRKKSRVSLKSYRIASAICRRPI